MSRRGMSVVAATAAVVVVVAGCTSSSPARTASTAPSPTPVGTTGAPVPVVTGSMVAPPPETTGRPGVPRGAPSAPVDTGDPTQVAARFAATTFIVDTAIDRSRFDAQRRSARWATPAYATALTAPVPVTGDHEFTVLADHHGYTTVTVAANTDDGRPPDLLRSAARSFTVTPTAHGERGWTQAWPARTMYIFLTRAGASAPWQVNRVTFADTGGGQ